MIRRLNTDDFDKLGQLGRSYFDEAKLPGVFNLDHFRLMLCIYERTGDLEAWGLFDEHQLNGVVIGIVSTELYTGDRVGTLFCMYVKPKKRGMGALLFRRWEKAVLERKVERIQVGHLYPFNDRMMGRFYRRMGYDLSEKSYTKIIKERKDLCRLSQ